MYDTPFEELERLVDYLPEEGESVVISRKDGELVCENLRGSHREELSDDRVMYGRLVQISERLRERMWLPIWAGLAMWLSSSALIHLTNGPGLGVFYGDLMLGLVASLLVVVWIDQRQRLSFVRDWMPSLARDFRQRGLERHAVLGSVKSHRELRPLFRQLVRWD